MHFTDRILWFTSSFNLNYVSRNKFTPAQTERLNVLPHQGRVTATAGLNFSVDATNLSEKPTLTNNATFTGPNQRSVQENSKICDTLCPSLFNVFCFLLTGCWGKLVRLLLIICCVCAAISGTLCCIRRGYCFTFCRACCGLIWSEGKSSKKTSRCGAGVGSINRATLTIGHGGWT